MKRTSIATLTTVATRMTQLPAEEEVDAVRTLAGLLLVVVLDGGVRRPCLLSHTDTDEAMHATDETFLD